MKEFEFTKGKWFIENKKVINEFGASGTDISSFYQRQFITIWGINDKDEGAKANAKLIAAAPELLYALINLVEIVENLPENKSILTAIDNAKRAIDKGTK